jgi:RNA polymerase sigma-70 factor (ECF subfamily)
MFLRKARNDRHVFEESLAEQIADVAQEAAPGCERQREALQRCLLKLHPDQRDLVLEAYAPGTRIDKLAQERGQTAMALYKVLHRIRILLFGCMQNVLGKESAYE